MQRHIISVSSITYAIKGRDFLRKHGYKAHIEKKTDINGNAGCGYVIVSFGNRDKIINTLSVANIKVLEINSLA